MDICIKLQYENDSASAKFLFADHKYANVLRNKSGETALHLLCKSTKIEMASYVISCGSEVNVKDYHGRTPLMLAVGITENIFMIERLLRVNADIYCTDIDGSSALGMVIDKSRGWLTTLKPCVEHLVILSLFFERVKNDFIQHPKLTLRKLQTVGCPKALVPFIKSTSIRRYLFETDFLLEERLSGLTALHVAVMSQDLVSMKILVAHDAEHLNVVDSQRQTALFAHDPLASGGAERFAILRLLLNSGASLYKSRYDLVTPMEYLLKGGGFRTIWTVLESKANLLDKCEPNGETALHFLIQNVNLNYTPREEVRFLLEKGFDVNVRDKDGISAFTYAIKHQFDKKIELLLKVGAKANWIEIVENTEMLDVFMNGYCGRKKTDYYQWVVQLIFHQQGINVRQLFDELNKGFIRKLDNLFYGQIVIAQLVICEAIGQRIPESIHDYIQSEMVFRVHYQLCKERIEEMKNIKVCDSLTFYQLLTQSEHVIDRYACNEDFLLEFQFTMTSDKSYQNLYYAVIVRKRVENAVEIKELREKSYQVVCECTGLNSYGINKDHCVVHKIVSYMSNRDIQILFGCQLLPKEIPIPSQRMPKVRGNVVSRAIRKFFARMDD